MRTLSEKEVAVLPLMEKIWLKGNKLVCNCSLRSFVSWVQTNKNNYDTSLGHELEVHSNITTIII